MNEADITGTIPITDSGDVSYYITRVSLLIITIGG